MPLVDLEYNCFLLETCACISALFLRVLWLHIASIKHGLHWRIVNLYFPLLLLWISLPTTRLRRLVLQVSTSLSVVPFIDHFLSLFTILVILGMSHRCFIFWHRLEERMALPLLGIVKIFGLLFWNFEVAQLMEPFDLLQRSG